MTLKKYCLALDLKNDPDLIDEYCRQHEEVWPEVLESIIASGIQNMEIYLLENRLFMIIEAEESFSFDRKAELDKKIPAVQKWEELMWKYQQALPGSKPGEKWRLMDCIFSLKG